VSEEETIPPDRRRSPRREPKETSRAACYVGNTDLGPNIAVSLLDVSESGLRLIVKEALEPGRDVVVGLKALGGGRKTLVPGVVAWCETLEGGAYCVGVKFDDPIRDAALHMLSRL
jgi:hypothetical protein